MAFDGVLIIQEMYAMNKLISSLVLVNQPPNYKHIICHIGICCSLRTCIISPNVSKGYNVQCVKCNVKFMLE